MITRGQEAAQEQAALLASQCVVGWGKGHPLALEAAALAERIQRANEAPPEPQEAASCVPQVSTARAPGSASRGS